MARGVVQNASAVSKAGLTAAFEPTGTGSSYYDYDYGVYDGPAQESVARDPADQSVVGIPNIGYIYSSVTGKSEPINRPLAGFEHLWNEEEFSQHFLPLCQITAPASGNPQKPLGTGLNRRQSAAQAHAERDAGPEPVHHETTKAQSKPRRTVKRKAKVPRTRIAKRSRSAAQLDARSDREEEEASGSTVTNVPTRSFLIGDEVALREFFRLRFRELTLKPLRRIVTEWIKLAEPERRKRYGTYHKGKPSEVSGTKKYPSWWPPHVMYFEPSHLKGRPLESLATEILLLHRYPDSKGQPRQDWIARLKKKAYDYAETAPAEDFAAAKQDKYNGAMKERAMKEILPDLFNAAQSYEDHVAMYDLYNGKTSNQPEATRGTQHTWIPASKVPRAPSTRPLKGGKRRCCDNSDSESLDSDYEMQLDDETDEEEMSHQSGVSNGSRSNMLSFQISPPSQQGTRALRDGSVTTPNTPQHMDGIRSDQSQERDSRNGGHFQMPLAPGYIGPQYDLTYHPSSWTMNHHIPAPAAGPHQKYGQPSFSDTQKQPFVHSQIHAVQQESHNFPMMGNQDLAYYMPRLDEKPQALHFTPNTSFGSDFSTDPFQPQFPTIPPDVIMSSPQGERLTFRPEAQHHYHGLPC